MNKRVLFITESYYQNPSPNGNCVKMVADELVKRGHYVSILTLKNQTAKQDSMIAQVNVTRINTYAEWRILFAKNIPQVIKRYGSKIIKFFKYVFVPIHPLRSPGVLVSLYRTGSKIVEKADIDTVVGVYRDFETAYAGVLIKKKYPHIKLCIYTLDAISGGVCSNHLINQKEHIKKCHRWEMRFLKVSDKFCIMKAHASIFQDTKYLVYRDKIITLDVPNLRIPEHKQKPCRKNNLLKFVFTGMLSETNADCTFFLKVFKEILKITNARFDIYGGISEGMLKTIERSGMYNKAVFFHGRVSQEELSSIRNEADIFLNFGNLYSCGIPCKIFEYIPMRKMIVSFYKIDADASFGYLVRYPKAILLRETDGHEAEYATEILKFWGEKGNIELSLETIVQEYFDNTPAAFVDVIEKM